MKTNPVVTELRGIEAAADRIIAERDQLREQNKELVEACGRLLKWGPTHNGKSEYHKDAAFARTILAKIT